MSEQIREQISAFLDGELPNSETELLLKRLTRDSELRSSFGRYALIGESMRGTDRAPLTRGFSERVNSAIDGEPVAPGQQPILRQPVGRWWRPVAGAAVAAGVAAVAVVALQQRAIEPTLRGVVPLTAQSVQLAHAPEAISYTVPAAAPSGSGMMPSTRLTNYVFAHTRYSSGLGQSSLSALLADPDDEVKPTSGVSDATLKEPVQGPAKDSRIAP